MELEFPVETIESLSFVLNRLLDYLCARLEARALAVQEMRLRLQLERLIADEDSTAVRNKCRQSVRRLLDRGLPCSSGTYSAAPSPCVMPRSSLNCCSWIWQQMLPALLVVKVWIAAGANGSAFGATRVVPAHYTGSGEIGNYAGAHQRCGWRAPGRHCAIAGHASARRFSDGAVRCDESVQP